MEEPRKDLGKATEHKRSTKESPLVEVERTFRASPEEVFRAWSSAELVKQWWGPEGYDCPNAKIDFREGGDYLYAMREIKSGETMWSAGKIVELRPNRKIVYTDSFSDSQGKFMTPKGFEDFGETYVTVEFEPLSKGETRMRLCHEGIPGRMHDDCVQGWSSSFDKLKRIVESH